jgi:hypothetical protein
MSVCVRERRRERDIIKQRVFTRDTKTQSYREANANEYVCDNVIFKEVHRNFTKQNTTKQKSTIYTRM